MNGTVSEVLVPLPSRPVFYLVTAHWLMHLYAFGGDQILALRVYIFFGEKTKKTTENRTISDIPQQILVTFRGSKKKPWNHWGKGASDPTFREVGSVDDQRLHLELSEMSRSLITFFLLDCKNMKRQKMKVLIFDRLRYVLNIQMLTFSCFFPHGARLDLPSTSDMKYLKAPSSLPLPRPSCLQSESDKTLSLKQSVYTYI